jgi:probable F420-dependent oxidoreductase
MKFTLFPPNIPANEVLTIAKAADQSGWHGMALPDCVFHPEEVTGDYPYSEDGLRHWDPQEPFVDPYTAIPAIAAVTENLRFYAAVLKAVLRQPLLLAKTLGTAEAMFPGRIGLGVGTSWMLEEFKWLDEDMASRGARLDELMQIIRICLKPGWAEFHGKHYDFDRLIMSPVPQRVIPIYVGGHAKPAIRRAATLGDGWIAAFGELDELKTVIPQMHKMRSDSVMAGRPFEVIVCSQGWRDIDYVRRLEDIGVDEIALQPFEAGKHPIELKSDSVVRFAEEVIRKC